MRKFICIGILAFMVILAAVPTYAANAGIESPGTQGVITPQYTYISTLTPGLEVNSSGKAICSGMASAYNSSHTTILTVELQKSGDWSTIKSWSASSTGVSLAKIEEDYYVVRGTYRVCATAKVYNASGTLLESRSIYSSTIKY